MSQRGVAATKEEMHTRERRENNNVHTFRGKIPRACRLVAQKSIMTTRHNAVQHYVLETSTTTWRVPNCFRTPIQTPTRALTVEKRRPAPVYPSYRRIHRRAQGGTVPPRLLCRAGFIWVSPCR